MPLDFSLLKPQTQVMSYGELMQQKLGMEQAKQQREMGQMQIAQKRQEMADVENLKRLSAETGGDPMKMATALRAAGKPEMAQKIELGMMERAKAEHEAQKANIEKVNAFNQAQLRVYNGIKDEASYQAALPLLAQNAKASGFNIDTTKSDHPPVYDPNFVESKKSQMMTFDQQLKAKELELKEREKGFKGFHAGADQTAYQVDDSTGRARQIIGPDGKPLRVPQQMAAITLQQMNSSYDGSTPLPKGMEVIAKAIANGDQDMMTSARTMPRFADINARAAVLREGAGGGDLLGKEQVRARGTGLRDFESGGKSGQTISALNTMTEHLNSAQRLAQALKNGDVQLINKIRQEFQKQTGSPAPTDFATIKQFLAGEVAKVATGGHLTEGEIKLAAEKLNASQSPEQLAGALDVMREVAGGKLVALNQDYKRYKGKTLAEDGRLTPATQKAFEEVNKKVNGGESGAKTLSQSQIGSLPPKVAEAYLSGKPVKGPDGTVYQKGK